MCLIQMHFGLKRSYVQLIEYLSCQNRIVILLLLLYSEHQTPVYQTADKNKVEPTKCRHFAKSQTLAMRDVNGYVIRHVPHHVTLSQNLVTHHVTDDVTHISDHVTGYVIRYMTRYVTFYCLRSCSCNFWDDVATRYSFFSIFELGQTVIC